MSLIPVAVPARAPISEVHTRVEAERQRIIKMATDCGDIATEVDGFVYFWPKNHGGFLAAHELRWIADELDRRNEPYEKQIAEYFEKHP